LSISTDHITANVLNDIFGFGQNSHDVFFFFGLPESFFGLANDSFESKLFFGPDVLSKPDESKSALREQFNLMNLSAINVVFLRSCGVILFGFGDILDLLFDFAEHVLEVREHR
jgi:hypothetical protein